MDAALEILDAVLALLLTVAAWCWIRFGQEPTEERRVAAAYVTACVLGYGALLAGYLALTSKAYRLKSLTILRFIGRTL